MEQGQFFKGAAFISGAFMAFDILVLIASGVLVYFFKFDEWPPDSYQLFY
jgi:hypothetical protein